MEEGQNRRRTAKSPNFSSQPLSPRLQSPTAFVAPPPYAGSLASLRLLSTATRIQSVKLGFASSEIMGDDPLSTGGAGSSAGLTTAQCLDLIQKSFTNPTVKFLMENLEKSGCGIRSNFIKAENCEEKVAGGFARGVGILVCSNQLQFQDEVDQVVIHELIHAYDDCRASNLDWINCAHQACSEIRANHLSGDCHFKRELLRGHLKIKGHEQECVKRRAMKSVIANPYCSQVAAKDAIESVWSTCYNDTTPFAKPP